MVTGWSIKIERKGQFILLLLFPSGNLILILFGRFENAAFHIPFSSENPFLKISSSHFLASF
jgi:hypothetical protein